MVSPRFKMSFTSHFWLFSESPPALRPHEVALVKPRLSQQDRALLSTAALGVPPGGGEHLSTSAHKPTSPSKLTWSHSGQCSSGQLPGSELDL